MTRIRKLQDDSPSLACQLLDEFLFTRLFSAKTEDWIEKAFITRIWISTSHAGNLDVLESLNRVVNTVSNDLTAPLSASAAHGAQSLLWKQVESHFVRGEYELADSWCRIASHKVFSNSGELNNAKIARQVSYHQFGDLAAAQAKASRRTQTAQSPQPFTIKELDWFSRNSYNIALRSCTDWDPRQSLRILQACIKFIDLYPKDMDANTLADLSLRRMFCDFLCASLLTVLARSEDNIEAQVNDDTFVPRYIPAPYANHLRNHVEAFRKRLQDELDRFELDDARGDLLKKYGALVAFDLEAAVNLRKWDDLGQIVEGAKVCNDAKVFGVLADIILLSKAPPATSYATDKLARWIRCLFQISLANDLKVAEELLNQVLTLARDSKIVRPVSPSPFFKGTSPYPTEELEWLATTAFNRAVDFYSSSDDTTCKRWAELALSVAQFSDDGGALHKLLQGNYLKMSWED
ncbi:hypothetical protein GP486_005082 [Trichoglossum hirsutum]|uniref:Uncharacterized protein n=1 Tax=Trichoglossum hirsutum TaxID=265104 RepID=A0A9P8L9Y5_9PEZI|nr:hypothetical protein GP486_005082 [Trichoglossum hirsutum]